MKTSQVVFALLLLGLEATQAVQLDTKDHKSSLLAQLERTNLAENKLDTKGYYDDDDEYCTSEEPYETSPYCTSEDASYPDDSSYTSDDSDTSVCGSVHKQKTVIKITVRAGD